MNKSKSVAEREILYSLKGQHDKKKLTVRIGAPYLIEKDSVNFAFDKDAACCTIEFDGIDEKNIDVHGIDTLHALTLAVDIDPYLRGMKDKYDFYWPTGESYFE